MEPRKFQNTSKGWRPGTHDTRGYLCISSLGSILSITIRWVHICQTLLRATSHFYESSTVSIRPSIISKPKGSLRQSAWLEKVRHETIKTEYYISAALFEIYTHELARQDCVKYRPAWFVMYYIPEIGHLSLPERRLWFCRSFCRVLSVVLKGWSPFAGRRFWGRGATGKFMLLSQILCSVPGFSSNEGWVLRVTK